MLVPSNLTHQFFAGVYIILLLLQICYTQKVELHYSVFETDL